MMKAATPSDWVRDQSPTSSHNRHDRPKAAHDNAATMPAAEARSHSRRTRARRTASAAPASDSEYVDIDALREFGRVGRRLEHRDRLQIVGITLQLALEHLADGMMMMGVVAHHTLEVLECGLLRRVGLERFRGQLRILLDEHR